MIAGRQVPWCNAQYFLSHFIPYSTKIKGKSLERRFHWFSFVLKSARELANEQGIEGDLAVKGGSLAIVNKTSNPIRNIHVWSSAFVVYASVMLEKWPSKGIDFFKYMHTVRMAVSRGYPQGWVKYDEQYRLRKALSPFSFMGCSWYGIMDVMRIHSSLGQYYY
jgi:hypothetical protein